MTESELLALFGVMFEGRRWPEAVRYLEGIAKVRGGMPLSEAARLVGTTARHLHARCSEGGVWREIGLSPEQLDTKSLGKARGALGQMLLGRVAERVFSDLYREAIQTEELQLLNLADTGTDTDYRVLNGRMRPVFRINIKYHGSQFRQAHELVGLEPTDCFALATYKIKSAVEKQDQEGLPYFFAIVGVPGLSKESVGAEFDPVVLQATALVLSSPRLGAKRKFEDAVIDNAVLTSLPLFSQTYDRVNEAKWYMLSARRAEALLKDKLWERVYALRVRSFTRTFSGAEVDMHFSLSQDLTPLGEFFAALRKGGAGMASTLLERGHL